MENSITTEEVSAEGSAVSAQTDVYSKEEPIDVEKLGKFRPLKTFAIVTAAFVGLWAVQSLAAVFADIWMTIYVKKIVANLSAYADGFDQTVFKLADLLHVLLIATWYVMFILFLIWEYKAYKNLDSLNVEARKYSKMWAVLFYFVPIIFFFYPFNVMSEIRKGSSPECIDKTEWSSLSSGVLVPVWWTLFIINALASYAGEFVEKRTTLQELNNYFLQVTIKDSTGVLLGIVSIILIYKITRMQKEKFERLAIKVKETMQSAAEMV